MRKIFIILCGILVMGDAFGAPNRYKEPYKTPETAWWNTGSNFSTRITDFYPDVSDEISINKPDSSDRHGTWSDEGSIIIWAAREIYKHGAMFCPVQIQGANRNARTYVWLDYYWDENKAIWTNCTTVCTKGYSGSKCENLENNECPKKYSVIAENGLKITRTNKIKKFQGLPSWKDLSGTGDTHRHTTDMTVIDFKTGTGDERETTHIVLGVIDEIDSGIKVAPIQIIGERTSTGGGVKSWIKSAMHNGDPMLLCYTGFYPTNDGKCAENPGCSERGAYDWCEGYKVDFDPDKHTVNFDNISKCNTYKCSIPGYGFKSVNDKTCVECEGSALAYIKSNGTCDKCPKGQIANDDKDRCVNITESYTKEQMKSNENRQCWLETDGRKFAGCVHECPGTTPCYIDGDCKRCD